MPHIALSQGLSAIVDARDVEQLTRYEWYAGKRKQTFYAMRHDRGGVGPRIIYMHRAILGVVGKVDHKNGDGLDNRRANLRAASDAQNAHNMRKCSAGGCSSRFKGVCLKRATGRWVASICLDYEQIHLGYFDIEEDAARAYDAKASELFGEFARLNLAGKAAAP